MIKETRYIETNNGEYTQYTLNDCTVEQLRNMLNDLIGEGKGQMPISVGGCVSVAYIHNLDNNVLLFDSDDLDNIISDEIDDDEGDE